MVFTLKRSIFWEEKKVQTGGDLADVGFGLVTAGVVPGPVEGAGRVHTDAALVLHVAGLSWSPLGEENWPAVRPRVGAVFVLRSERT